MKIRRLSFHSADFPDCLRHIPDPPSEIFVLGDLTGAMQQPRLAIVGTRKMTPYGREVTTVLAAEAAEAGITIISGLALGVDATAHEAALLAGGRAIAVLGSGLDVIAPRTNYYLAQQILEAGGALVSEYPPGIEAQKHHFIARNRLIAGLSDAILITEAALKSGTFHTVNFALDQGKTVMVVPGNIDAPQSKGTNQLLKEGAQAVTSIKDILEGLGTGLSP